MVFLGDIAFYMATLVLAAGLFMIHHSNHHDKGKPCRLLKSGGYLVTVIALLGMLCTGYFWMKYFLAGSYEKSYSQNHSMMMRGGMNKMGKMSGMQHCMGQMEGKTMSPEMMGKMKGCMMQKMDEKPNEMDKAEHESHH